MRLVDEITERPAPQPLPAPTGPRLPTGQVPATPVAPAAPVEPGPLLEVPTLPRLAPSTPKPTGPPTGQVATTALSLEAFLAANASGGGVGKPAPVKEKRSHKLLIVLGGLMAAILLLGVVFRNTAIVQRFTGKGYDTNPLPVHAVPRPAFSGAVFTSTTQSIANAPWHADEHLDNRARRGGLRLEDRQADDRPGARRR